MRQGPGSLFKIGQDPLLRGACIGTGPKTDGGEKVLKKRFQEYLYLLGGVLLVARHCTKMKNCILAGVPAR